MGNEQSGNGQPTAGDEKSEGTVSTEERAEDSADQESGGEVAPSDGPESETATGESSEAGGESEPPEGGSPTPTPAPPSGGAKPVILAITAVLALIVGLVVGLAIGGSSSDDDGEADEAAGEGDAEGHEGHGDMEMSDEESGLAQLMEDHHYHPPADESIDPETTALLTAQLAPLDEYVKDFPTIADAKDAGWRRAGPFIPGLGTHYIRPEDADVTFTIRESLDGDEDEGVEVRPVLIYDGLEDDAALVGFMPMALGEQATDFEEEGPFAGPYDTWHRHTNVCVVPGEKEGDPIDLPFVGDMDSTTEETCADVGGNLTELTSHMLHVWSIPGYDSELGMFSEVNPRITCPDGTYHRVPYDELESPYLTACPGE